MGELQEVSQKRFRTMPTYKFSDEQGPPHDREFVCSVSVFKYFEKGMCGACSSGGWCLLEEGGGVCLSGVWYLLEGGCGTCLREGVVLA